MARTRFCYDREGSKCEREKKGELFVCVSSVQWSHQEASSVCEALLSQRIPSPSSILPPSSSSLSSISGFPETWILSVTILLKKTPPSYHSSFILRLSSAVPPKALVLWKGRDPGDLLLTPAWPLQVSFSVSCSCGAAKSPDNPITQSLVLSRPEPEQVSVCLCRPLSHNLLLHFFAHFTHVDFNR